MIEQDQGWVLHRIPYKESSWLVDFLSLQHGRLRGIYRKKKSQPHVSPFQPYWIRFNQKNSGLVSIYDIEHKGAAIILRAGRLFCGYYLNELLIRCLKQADSDAQIIVSYEKTLKDLQTSQQLGGLLRLFELELLESLGYGLPFHQLLSDQNTAYLFDPDQGFTADQDGPYPGQLLTQLKYRKIPNQCSLSKQLLRSALSPLIGSKPLESRKLFQKIAS